MTATMHQTISRGASCLPLTRQVPTAACELRSIVAPFYRWGSRDQRGAKVTKKVVELRFKKGQFNTRVYALMQYLFYFLDQQFQCF